MTKFDDLLVQNGGRIHQGHGRRLAPMPTGDREIDKEGGVRTRPMKVILASMSRTGTVSMYTAFQKLDLHPYHMVEAIKMPARDLPIAIEAIDARNTEKSYGMTEFDKWIGDFDTVCDVPMNLLVKELIEAYPDAKVILTTRDPAKWRKSIENSILVIDKWRVWGYLKLISPDCAAFVNMMHKMDEVMDGYSIAALNRHNAGVRQVVPKEKLLEFTLGQDGWKELCEFIELPQPEGDFPNVNDGKMFATMHVILINIWIMKALKDAAARVAPWAILLGSLWIFKRLEYFWQQRD